MLGAPPARAPIRASAAKRPEYPSKWYKRDFSRAADGRRARCRHSEVRIFNTGRAWDEGMFTPYVRSFSASGRCALAVGVWSMGEFAGARRLRQRESPPDMARRQYHACCRPAERSRCRRLGLRARRKPA